MILKKPLPSIHPEAGASYVMQTGQELIPHLFRTEYRKIIAVLCKLFGIEHIDLAEDMTSDTFLQAAETWGIKGLPENPVAWLYAVAKNKAKDHLKRNALFAQKIAPQVKQTETDPHNADVDVDLSSQNINDSQLQMMFAICSPAIPAEAQIGLSLSILCGFGAEEIADAFLTSKEAIYKRLSRAKEKLKADRIPIALPPPTQINDRLDTVLTTLYLLFNEGYHSASQNKNLRKDLCLEAMRLNYLLINNETTNTPAVNALMALMCFHASRFDARMGSDGEAILYEDQDTTLWNEELIMRGKYYLTEATKGPGLTRYHLEAAIASLHTQQADTKEKWEHILQLYNKLLQLQYSPIAALNRTYALAKAHNKHTAIAEAEKLQMDSSNLYHSLLGYLYTDLDNEKALHHLQTALTLTRSGTDKVAIMNKIRGLAERH